MVVIANDHIGKSIIKNGIYAKHEVNYLTELLGHLRPTNILDIGANIGNHALPFSLHAKNVWCFEPNPQVFEILSKNIELNGSTNIKAIPAGLSDRNATTTLHVDLSGNIGASTLVDKNQFHGVKYEDKLVEVIVGDEWVTENIATKIDFIKIDVEGHEYNVLKGLKSTLAEHRPIIAMEWSKKSTDREEILGSGFFEKELQGYHIFSTYINTQKSIWTHKWLGNLRRIIYKLTHEKKFLLKPFSKNDPISVHTNLIILVPNEKKALIQGA